LVGAGVDNPLGQGSSPPFGDQQPDQRFAGAGGQLKRDIGRQTMVGVVDTQ
jgi:hypothetical protein